MKNLLLILLCALAATSCHTSRSIETARTSQTVTAHDTVLRISYRDRIVADTVRDSIYVREVVTTEGKTVYVEKNTSRDHKAQTIVKHDTVFVRTSATARTDSASVVRQALTSGGVRVGMQEFLFLVCVVGVYVLALVGLYFYNQTGK